MKVQSDWARRRLWQFQPVRDLAVLALSLGVAWCAFRLSFITGPALLALLLAALANPMFRGAQQRWGVPRWVTALVLVTVVVALGALIGSWLVPQVAHEASELGRALPARWDATRDWLVTQGWMGSSDQDSLALPDLLTGGLSAFNRASSVLGSVVTLLVAFVYFVTLFLFFAVRFERLPDLRRYLPKSRRSRWTRLIAEFASAFTGYLRGQLIVAAFTTCTFALGFSLLGVPFALVAALIGGLLSFIPNGQVSGLLCAWLFGIVSDQPIGLVETFVYPALVYVVSQSLETFVVTPMVQGRETKMHPLVVLSALLAGASLGGVAGIFLAIPLAACIKIVGVDLLLPELRQFADRS